MNSFVGDDFLLSTATAKCLFHDVASKLPIIDYHCHVNPKDIAENTVYENIAQLWLDGDHYKWRLMRSNGVNERYITGDMSDFEKFEQWAFTLDKAIGNPVYQWCHMELRRYFGYEGYLSGANAKEVWSHCLAKKPEGFSVHELLRKSDVTLLCTTDDPVDTLVHHQAIAADGRLETKVLPAFRPDRVMNPGKADFVDYIGRLSTVSGVTIVDWQSLKAALSVRIDYFDRNGCRISDHGLNNIDYLPASESKIDGMFKERLSGGAVSEVEEKEYQTELLRFFAESYSEKGWVMQLHFSAMRNNNTAMFSKLGSDAGYDSIGSPVNIKDLSRFMDRLASMGKLPRIILYSLNPYDNELLVALMGCFQTCEARGKIQHGSAWWFNDHNSGIRNQLRSLASLGLLGNFIGMLTDSRSFLSYIRHEYFRRILCDLVGQWVESGEYPQEETLLKRLVADISYHNAVRYFGLQSFHLRGAETL